jgi:hypothetical protein
MKEIIINLAVEDDLSEAILREIIKKSQHNFTVGFCLKRQGFSYLKSIINGLNKAAQGTPFLVLTDLDRAPCPLEIISTWLKQPKHPNLLFRVAVKEVEAWLLADREGFARFLGISEALIPPDVEQIPEPKQYLIQLAKKSRKLYLRDSIVPTDKTTAKIGKNYNAVLIQFIQEYWQVEAAQINSRSLERTMRTLTVFSEASQNK